MVRTAILALAAASIMLPSAGSAQVLWGELTAGMPKQQVKARYPSHRIQVTDKCKGWLSFDYEDGGLRSVTLEAPDPMAVNRCGPVIEATLMEKYGPPAQFDATAHVDRCARISGKVGRAIRRLCDPKIEVTDISHWRIGDVQVTLLRPRDDESQWIVNYQLAPKAAPEALDRL